ncbi:hypothetical protein [Sphingobacterium pedocola]|uniref:Lipoprotein n=1 Tax=Sphingobacterium pedocola TaxID=2082722 RepID=A0ABR9T4V7_9SPHI|nr:hypothetical protein [Sphingobacterium pedocola]MBE8720368.1 hypothetical protein [Sphingobacterium pedocola]
MKQFAVIILLSLAACGRESSPDGRSQLRDENIQNEIGILKDQNEALSDSIKFISEKLKQLKESRN